MAQVLVSYDIPINHSAFKREMVSKGYSDKILGTGGNTNLPNTTLVKNGITSATGLSDLQAAAKTVGVTLERAIAVEIATWNGIVGQPHS